jgi:hypothetical protein
MKLYRNSEVCGFVMRLVYIQAIIHLLFKNIYDLWRLHQYLKKYYLIVILKLIPNTEFDHVSEVVLKVLQKETCLDPSLRSPSTKTSALQSGVFS